MGSYMLSSQEIKKKVSVTGKSIHEHIHKEKILSKFKQSTEEIKLFNHILIDSPFPKKMLRLSTIYSLESILSNKILNKTQK